MLKWVVTLYDELQHFEAKADAQTTTFFIRFTCGFIM